MKRIMARLFTITAIVLVLALLPGITPAQAARDRTPPTTPTNLRVTGMTPYSVSLAWNPSTDNSGSITYTICCASSSSETFAGPASTRIYRAGLEAGRSFTLRIFAKDASGNASKYSNSVTFRLPADTAPPTQPIVSVTDVGATYISLAWASSEDGPNVWFNVQMNGNPVRQGVRDTSGSFGPLEPETAYTFTVQARDFAGNLSPLSAPLTVTTEAFEPNEMPPTPPTNLTDRGMSFPDGETWLFWDQSTDDIDPQSSIRYDIYVNGVLDHSLMGADSTIVYGNPGTFNTYEVIAVDAAGNRSAPASLTTCAGTGC